MLEQIKIQTDLLEYQEGLMKKKESFSVEYQLQDDHHKYRYTLSTIYYEDECLNAKKNFHFFYIKNEQDKWTLLNSKRHPFYKDSFIEEILQDKKVRLPYLFHKK